jgi:hypothetical protein
VPVTLIVTFCLLVVGLCSTGRVWACLLGFDDVGTGYAGSILGRLTFNSCLEKS